MWLSAVKKKSFDSWTQILVSNWENCQDFIQLSAAEVRNEYAQVMYADSPGNLSKYFPGVEYNERT